MKPLFFILNYIEQHPGSKTEVVREALCEHMGKPYFGPDCFGKIRDLGYYTWYFSKSRRPQYEPLGRDYGYFTGDRCTGLFLTEKGVQRLAQYRRGLGR